MNKEDNNIINDSQTDIQVSVPVDTPQTDSGKNLITGDSQTAPIEISKHDNSGAVANTEDVEHDFYSQFSRYVKIGTFNYTTGDGSVPDIIPDWQVVATPLASYSLPQAIFDASGFIKCRLGHWAYIKTDIQIQVKLNANQFQLGAILISYIPADALVSPFLAQSIHSMQGLSSIPTSMILHCDGGTTGVMTIPYASIVDAFSLDKADNQFGTLYIYPLVNILGPTDNESASGTVFARFVKPDWQVPSHFEYTSGPVGKLTRFEQDDIRTVLGKYGLRMNDLDIRQDDIIAEIGEGKEEGGHHGPISGLAAKVSTIGSSLSHIPVIGSVASLASDIASGVSAVSSALGFSKPHNDVTPEFVVNTPGIGITNALGKDNSHTLAMVPGNSIDASKSTASKADEMSIDYIKQFPTIVRRETISKDNWKANNLIFSFPVSPVALFHTGYGTASMGCFQYVTSLFKYWRGTLNYDINIIKTNYHNGRFVVVYLPLSLTAPPTLDDKITTCYSMMYDLENGDKRPDGCHFTFSVPYMSNRPWHNVLSKNATFDTDADMAHGTIGIYALTDLIVPSTVNQSLTLVQSVWGGDDFEVAYPVVHIAAGVKEQDSIPAKDRLTTEFVSLFHSSSNLPRKFLMTFNSTFTEDTHQVFAFHSDDDETENLVAVYDTVDYQTTITSNVIEGTHGNNVHFSVYMPDNHKNPQNITLQPYVSNGFIRFISLDSSGQPSGMFVVSSTWSANDPLYFVYKGVNLDEDMETDEITAEISAPQPLSLVPHTKFTPAREATMGEFVKSLRFYIKRPTRIGIVRGNVSGAYTPFLNEFDSNGLRATRRVTSLNNIKESQLSLASYLFRFYCGGFRTKIIMFNTNALVHSGLTSGSSSDVSDSSTDPNPSYTTFSHVNNVAETTVPFYSAFRSRILNAVELQDTTKQWIYSNKNSHFWEAASEDTTFHFLVPPPIVHKTIISTTHQNNPIW